MPPEQQPDPKMKTPSKKVKVTLPKVKVIKHEQEMSVRSLVIFILAFAVIGYLIYRTFAAGPVVASVQGEQMSLPAGASVITDSSASGGQALKLSQNATATASVSLPSQATSLNVSAKADSCSGSPTMSVSVDGKSVAASTSVGSSSYANFASTSLNLASGSHTLSITGSGLGPVYRGKSNNPKCYRNLYIDVTTFYGPAASPPTVSLSANPASITSGQSSTLSWSSTNATSCTASGAWSGSLATSGTKSVAPTAVSTYSLSCTGSGGSATASATVTVNTGSSLSLGSMLFGDEFNGPAGSLPSSTLWGAKQLTANLAPTYFAGWNQISEDGGGHLAVKATYNSSTGLWDSGFLYGKVNYSGPRYIEVRAQMPCGYGTWAAPVWETGGGAPQLENDVIEQLGREPQAYHATLHYWYQAGSSYQSGKSISTGQTLCNDFHTYGAAVYSDHVDFYFDGTKMASTSASAINLTSLTTWADHVNINLYMGGLGGTPTISGPVSMLLDYIHVYRLN